MPEGTEWQCGSLIDGTCIEGEIACFVPLDNHAEIAAQIASYEEHLDGVVYPRIGRLKGTSSGPLVPEPWYGLPPTHKLVTSDPIDSVSADLIIELFGFLLGVPLRPQGWGYLHPAAVKEGRWIDVAISRKDGARALDHIVRGVTGQFPSNTVRSIRAGINAYFLSVSQQQPYQTLVALYIALDRASDALQLSSSNDYSIRAVTETMFERLQVERTRFFLPCYEMGLKNSGRPRRRSETSLHNMIRNDLVHFGEFNRYSQTGTASNGYPLVERTAFNVLGSAHPPEGYEMDLAALASRALVAAMGLNCRYASSEIGTRQTNGLDLI